MTFNAVTVSVFVNQDVTFEVEANMIHQEIDVAIRCDGYSAATVRMTREKALELSQRLLAVLQDTATGEVCAREYFEQSFPGRDFDKFVAGNAE